MDQYHVNEKHAKKKNFKFVIKCNLHNMNQKKLEAIENKVRKQIKINFLYEIGF